MIEELGVSRTVRGCSSLSGREIAPARALSIRALFCRSLDFFLIGGFQLTHVWVGYRVLVVR